MRTDPRLYVLNAADAKAVTALHESGIDPARTLEVSVTFSGSQCDDEFFRGTMVIAGWDILATGEGRINLGWTQTTRDDDLRALVDRIALISGAYGVVYEGWAFSVPWYDREEDGADEGAIS